MEKLEILLSLIYLEIYLVVDVMNGIKKVKIKADKLDKFPSKKKKKSYFKLLLEKKKWKENKSMLRLKKKKINLRKLESILS